MKDVDLVYDDKLKLVEGFNADNKLVLFCDENNFEVTLYGNGNTDEQKTYKFYDYKRYHEAVGDNLVMKVLPNSLNDFLTLTYDKLRENCDIALFKTNLEVYGFDVDKKNNMCVIDVNGKNNVYLLSAEQIDDLSSFVNNFMNQETAGDHVECSKEELNEICSRMASNPSMKVCEAVSGVIDTKFDLDMDLVAFDVVDINGEKRSFELSVSDAIEARSAFEHSGSKVWIDENDSDYSYVYESTHCFSLEEFADKLEQVCNGERDIKIVRDLYLSGADMPRECIVDGEKGNFVLELNDQLVAVDKNMNARVIDSKSVSDFSTVIKIDENFTLNNFPGNVIVADVLMQIENKSNGLMCSLDGNPVQRNIQDCIKRLDQIKSFDINEASASGFTFAEKLYLEKLQSKISSENFKLSDFRTAEMAVINDMIVSNEFFIDEIKEVVANYSPFCVSRYGESQADYLVNDCVNVIDRERYSKEVEVSKSVGFSIDALNYNFGCKTFYLASRKENLKEGMGFVDADRKAVSIMLDHYSIEEVKNVLKDCSPVFVGNSSGAFSFVEKIKSEKAMEKVKIEKVKEKIQEKSQSKFLNATNNSITDKSQKNKNQHSGSGSGRGSSSRGGNDGR